MGHHGLIRIIGELADIMSIIQAESDKGLQRLRGVCGIIDDSIPYHGRHGQRVSTHALAIGRQIGLSKDSLVNLEAAGLLHDFGKVTIERAIIEKKGPMTAAERIEMQYHAIRGYFFLSGIVGIEEILQGVRSHHEHYDGSGYPCCLYRGEIPLFGRIIAVADAYDAMTSERPYRRTKTEKKAQAELNACSGRQFDPGIVRIFIQILQKKRKRRK